MHFINTFQLSWVKLYMLSPIYGPAELAYPVPGPAESSVAR